MDFCGRWRSGYELRILIGVSAPDPEGKELANTFHPNGGLSALCRVSTVMIGCLFAIHSSLRGSINLAVSAEGVEILKRTGLLRRARYISATVAVCVVFFAHGASAESNEVRYELKQLNELTEQIGRLVDSHSPVADKISSWHIDEVTIE